MDWSRGGSGWGEGYLCSSSSSDESWNVFEVGVGLCDVLYVVCLDYCWTFTCCLCLYVKSLDFAWDGNNNNWCNNFSLLIPQINCLTLHSFFLQNNSILHYILWNGLGFSTYCYCCCLGLFDAGNYWLETFVGLGESCNGKSWDEVGWDGSWCWDLCTWFCWDSSNWDNICNLRGFIVEYNSFNMFLLSSFFFALKNKMNFLNISINNLPHTNNIECLKITIFLDNSLNRCLYCNIRLNLCGSCCLDYGVAVAIALLKLDAWNWRNCLDLLDEV